MRIFNKNRNTYKRTYQDACAFCGADTVLECEGLSNEHWRVLVNRFPYMDGNLMLVPRRHVETVEEISTEEWVEFGKTLTKTQDILTKIFNVKSFNIGLNVGPESGASIAHLHWQIIPRKFKNITAVNTFADLHVVAMAPEETKKLIDDALCRSFP